MQYNKKSFLQEIFLFVFGTHCLLLVILFVCDKGKYHQEKFVISTNNLQSTIVFMPLKKRVVPLKSSRAKVSQQDNKRHVMSFDEYEKKVSIASSAKVFTDLEKKAAESIKTQPEKIAEKKQVIEKLVEKVKIESSFTKATADKSQKSPTMIKTEVKKKSEPVAKKLNPVVKKQEKKPMDKPKKSEIKKPATKNEAVKATREALEKKKEIDKPKLVEVKEIETVVEEKKQEAVIEKVIEPIMQESTTPVSVLHSSVPFEQDSKVDEAIDLEHVSFVGSLDLEMMQIKEQIQVGIAQYYKPPVGISKKAVCLLSVLIGKSGKADRVTIKKSSGSVANDMCARAALLKVTFPKEVINKEIIIELGQS